MALVTSPEFASRGLSAADKLALASLQMFLREYNVTDVDLEPQVSGVKITASRIDGKPAFTAWGANIKECVANMIRCVTK